MRLALSDAAAFKALIEDRPVRFALSPTGLADSASGSPAADFLAIVKAREAEGKPYHVALSEVSRESPELYKAYTASVTGQKQEGQ